LEVTLLLNSSQPASTYIYFNNVEVSACLWQEEHMDS